MCCLITAAGFIGPRFALLIWWIFGNKVELAFGSWLWPFLGLLFLPWTTLAYVIAWQPGGISGGWDLVLILVGMTLDVVTYTNRFAAKSVGYS
jgi:hypothetical protein